MLDKILKEAAKVQPLKSQEGIMKRFFKFFADGNVPDGDLLEIGSFMGKTTVFLSRMCEELYPERRLFSIDPHTDDSLSEITMANKCEDRIHSHFSKHTAHLTNHKHYRDYSTNVVEEFEDGSLAFLFNDGLHTYEATLEDFNNYLPKVMDGGIVVFDDYRSRRFGVWRVINEIINDPCLEVVAKEEKEIYFRVVGDKNG